MSTRTIQEALDINYSIGITYLPSGDTVSFSAYLENFTDSFKQQWEAEDVYGRMDSILTYKNTKRNIDLTFNVPSESDIDAQANFIKLGKLIRFCYPVYEKGIQFTSDQDIDAYIKQGIRPTKFGNATLLSSPPLVGIKFANLISSNGFGGKLICKMEDVSYSISDKEVFYSKNNTLFTNVYKVQLKLTVVHSSPLGWERDQEGKVKLRDAFKKFPYNT